MEYVNPLGEEKISKLLWKFSLPAIVGMMVNALYNVVDRIYIGNSADLGSNGIAGITIAFPIMIILLAVGILFGIGGATLFSMKLGEKKPDEAENALGNAFVMLILSGIMISIMGQIFLKPLLIFFGADKEILPYSIEYMRIILFGAVFQIIGIGLNNFIRADGNPKTAMLTMFFGAGVNIVLDPIFIYGFKMGMAGAALATIISQFCSAIWVMMYFRGKKSHHKLKIKNIKPNIHVIIKITSLGMPNFSMQFVNSILNAVLNKSLMFYGGNLAISGMGIVNSIQTILIMPVIGLNQGVQPIISFNYGAQKYARVKDAEALALKAATAVVTVGFIITKLFPGQLISMFNREPNLVEFGSYALQAWFLCLPVVGFQIISSNFFQAIGKYKTAMILTLTRQVILLIPAVLILPRFWGIKGLLHAAPLADAGSFILTGICFIRTIKKLGHEDEGKNSESVFSDTKIKN